MYINKYYEKQQLRRESNCEDEDEVQYIEDGVGVEAV